ncbi:hypothetical protein H0H93_015167 [Arthromyces matolae]|nr:hypothetical protein H0H93_015167 [Arthromyces matolae]
MAIQIVRWSADDMKLGISDAGYLDIPVLLEAPERKDDEPMVLATVGDAPKYAMYKKMMRLDNGEGDEDDDDDDDDDDDSNADIVAVPKSSKKFSRAQTVERKKPSKKRGRSQSGGSNVPRAEKSKKGKHVLSR